MIPCGRGVNIVPAASPRTAIRIQCGSVHGVGPAPILSCADMPTISTNIPMTLCTTARASAFPEAIAWTISSNYKFL